jgi:chromosome segregation ATPase
LTEKFCQELETPDNEDRWRALLGDDPDVEQLQAKLQVLEERLNGKKEQMLEKELVLEEVTELTAKLKNKATEGRHNTLELAKSVNAFQARIKETTRRMMALVSELSMYQATALKLEQEKSDKEKELEDAEWKNRNNQPPYEEAEYEWFRIEREMVAKKRTGNQAAERDPMAPVVKKAARTTATPRPNAYSPDTGLGIPKPYGAQAPFKPQPAGSTIRHIRKPKIQEIII